MLLPNSARGPGSILTAVVSVGTLKRWMMALVIKGPYSLTSHPFPIIQNHWIFLNLIFDLLNLLLSMFLNLLYTSRVTLNCRRLLLFFPLIFPNQSLNFSCPLGYITLTCFILKSKTYMVTWTLIIMLLKASHFWYIYCIYLQVIYSNQRLQVPA